MQGHLRDHRRRGVNEAPTSSDDDSHYDRGPITAAVDGRANESLVFVIP
jgi:hypothetical protein